MHCQTDGHGAGANTVELIHKQFILLATTSTAYASKLHIQCKQVPVMNSQANTRLEDRVCSYQGQTKMEATKKAFGENDDQHQVIRTSFSSKHMIFPWNCILQATSD